MINVSDELQGYNKERATQKVKSVYNQIGKIFNITSEKNILPLEAAEHLSEERIEALLRIHSKFSSKANNQINK